jgi:hypothetical protein
MQSGVMGGAMLCGMQPRVHRDVHHRYNYKMDGRDVKRGFTFPDKN